MFSVPAPHQAGSTRDLTSSELSQRYSKVEKLLISVSQAVSGNNLESGGEVCSFSGPDYLAYSVIP